MNRKCKNIEVNSKWNGDIYDLQLSLLVWCGSNSVASYFGVIVV